MKITTTLFLGIFLVFELFAQECDCDHSVESTKTFLDGAASNINPGDIVCLQAGQWRNLMMRNIIGTKEKPIVIINCGGEARIGNNDFYYGLVFENSKHFRLTGTGVESIKYGIKITGTETGSGISLNSLSSDFEIDHIEVSNTGFAGITAKTDPTCEPDTWRENFTMENILIHHNYIHDTEGEGMYIGNTRLHGTNRTCEGEVISVVAHFIKHLRVYNNIIENTGWDGLQVSMANEDCEVYNNHIENFGVEKKGSQDVGMVIGGGSSGKFYNNRIINGAGPGMAIYGLGENYVFNNLIYGPGYDGILIQDNETVTPGWGFHIIHNNIINPGRDGIRMYSEESTGSEFYNNIIINPGAFDQYETFTGLSGEDSYIFIVKDRPIDYTAANNYTERDISKVLFLDPDNMDFRLKPESPAIDAGKDFSNYGISFDQYNFPRPTGDFPDIGMLEFQTENENAPFIDINVYPNPIVDDKLFLQISSAEVQNLKITFISTTGTEILDINTILDIGANSMVIDLAEKDISYGLYFLKVSFNKKTKVFKVLY